MVSAEKQKLVDMEQHQAILGQRRVPKPSSFQFVTFQDLHSMRDPSNLSRVRQHAMRDIGASRRRRSNPRRRAYGKIPLELLSELDMPLPSPTVTGLSNGGVDPFVRLPIELDGFGRELIINSTSKPDS